MAKRRTVGSALVALGCLGGAVWAAQPDLKLMLNETPLSTQVRMVDGRPYAPLADFAKALNMTVARKSGGYVLTPLGGSGATNGVYLGKQKKELATARWGFTVTEVQEIKAYQPRYLPDREPIQPLGVGDTLFAIHCRLRNLQKVNQKIAFDDRSLSGSTALTDDQQHSYAPHRYDVHADETSPLSCRLLPGSVVDFAVVFSVPQGTKARDLFCTLQNFDDRYSDASGTDIRISLAE